MIFFAVAGPIPLTASNSSAEALLMSTGPAALLASVSLDVSLALFAGLSLEACAQAADGTTTPSAHSITARHHARVRFMTFSSPTRGSRASRQVPLVPLSRPLRATRQWDLRPTDAADASPRSPTASASLAFTAITAPPGPRSPSPRERGARCDAVPRAWGHPASRRPTSRSDGKTVGDLESEPASRPAAVPEEQRQLDVLSRRLRDGQPERSLASPEHGERHHQPRGRRGLEERGIQREPAEHPARDRHGRPDHHPRHEEGDEGEADEPDPLPEGEPQE